MATTRSRVLAHLIGTVLGQDESSPLALALNRENVTTLADLMGLFDYDIDTLMYSDKDKSGKNKKPQDVPRWAKRLLIILQSYIHYKNSEGVTDFTTLTKDDYDHYRSFVFNSNAPHVPTSTTFIPSNPSSKGTNPFNRSPAEEFKKTVKRDKAHYKALKTDKQWDSWNRSTISTARTHGCEDVLDSKYVPRTQEDKDLFDEKQKFMYSVFEDYLQTDKGKYYVRLYAKNYDAQAVYKGLSHYATSSTQASLDSSALLT